MSDEVFASYKSDLTELKTSLASEEGFDKTDIEKAKAAAASLSIATDLNGKSLVSKMAQL